MLVEVEQNFVSRPVIPLTNEGITMTCREHSAMRDGPAAEAKGALGDKTIFGPVHDAKIALQMDDTALRCRSVP